MLQILWMNYPSHRLQIQPGGSLIPYTTNCEVITFCTRRSLWSSADYLGKVFQFMNLANGKAK